MPSVGVSEVFFEWSLLKSALSPGFDPENPRSVFNSTFVERFRWVLNVPHEPRFEPCGFFMNLSQQSPHALPHVPITSHCLIYCEICTGHVSLLPKTKLSAVVGSAEHCPAPGAHSEMVPGLRQNKSVGLCVGKFTVPISQQWHGIPFPAGCGWLFP